MKESPREPPSSSVLDLAHFVFMKNENGCVEKSRLLASLDELEGMVTGLTVPQSSPDKQ